MSSATLSNPKPLQTSLFERHKADILAGGDGLESGRKLGLLLGEIRAHAATFARRKQLAHDLSVNVPRLEAEARDAQKQSELLLGLADRPFTDIASTDWLVALRLPVDATLQQFTQGIAKHMEERLQGKQQSQDAAMRASGLRDQATRGLWETASTALHSRLDDTRNKMLVAAKKIEAADKWLREIDGRLARCRDRCERLFRGEQADGGPTTTILLDGGRSQQEAQHRRFEAAKAELAKLQAEAATRPQVESERVRNSNEHAVALAERNAILAAMLLPENMRFHGAQ